MSMKINHQLCSPETLKKEYPMADSLKALKQKRDEEIKAIFAGESDKFIVLIGPCSADNEDAVCEYVGRLARVNEQVKDKLMIIPRVYTNKPRTTGRGIKECSTNRSRMKRRIFTEGSSQSARCTFALFRTMVLHVPMRCSIRKTEAT